MNKRQKEVIQSQLKDEEKIIKKLKATYNKAIKDINQKIRLLQADELTQSKIYQIEYQKALKMQIKAILDNMNANQYTDIQEYLRNCYHEGFLGTMYDLQGQGIPLVFPIDQGQVVKALVNDTKLSKSLYESLGFNVNTLKKQINAEISRGIANGYSYHIVARNVENKTLIGLNKSIRIARTEGHRIQQQATFDAQKGAKERGADIVKQWDSTMDKKTRPNHVKLDGQIRELDDPFEVNGKTAMFPADFGVPHEDINCRCVMLQRARWALNEGETTKMNNETKEIIKINEKNFESFKKVYQEKAHEISIKDKINEAKEQIISLRNERWQLTEQKNQEKDSEKRLEIRKQISELNMKIFETRSRLTNEINVLLKEFNFDFDSAILNLKKYSNLSVDELDEFVKCAGKISREQRRIIYDGINGYVATSNSFGINRYLRTGDKRALFNTNKSIETIEELEKVIRNNHASKDIILHRFVGDEYLDHFKMINSFDDAFYSVDHDLKEMFVKEFNACFAGENEVFDGFTSTSWDVGKNVFTDRPIKLTVHVPQGSNLYMTDNDIESEVILNKGANCKIIGAKLDGDVFNIFMELID